MVTSLSPFRDPLLDVSGERVGFYPREFYPLDNFAAFAFDWDGRRWPTVEHAYQSTKFKATHPEIYQEIVDSRSPDDARKIAQQHNDKVAAAFHDNKIELMVKLCRAKLDQNPYVEKKLQQTGELEIVEDSPKDSFWGWGPDRDGQNHMGKIWMKLRAELRDAEKGNSQ
jgi:ribA/ribD-fused uncharacterized protein